MFSLTVLVFQISSLQLVSSWVNVDYDGNPVAPTRSPTNIYGYSAIHTTPLMSKSNKEISINHDSSQYDMAYNGDSEYVDETVARSSDSAMPPPRRTGYAGGDNEVSNDRSAEGEGIDEELAAQQQINSIQGIGGEVSFTADESANQPQSDDYDIVSTSDSEVSAFDNGAEANAAAAKQNLRTHDEIVEEVVDYANQADTEYVDNDPIPELGVEDPAISTAWALQANGFTMNTPPSTRPPFKYVTAPATLRPIRPPNFGAPAGSFIGIVRQPPLTAAATAATSLPRRIPAGAKLINLETSTTEQVPTSASFKEPIAYSTTTKETLISSSVNETDLRNETSSTSTTLLPLTTSIAKKKKIGQFDDYDPNSCPAMIRQMPSLDRFFAGSKKLNQSTLPKLSRIVLLLFLIFLTFMLLVKCGIRPAHVVHNNVKRSEITDNGTVTEKQDNHVINDTVVYVDTTTGAKRISVITNTKRAFLEGKIVGGARTFISLWPWQASLRYFGLHMCGGSLINDRFIVTAAHCFITSKDPADWTVYFGKSKNRVGEKHEIGPLKIKEIIVHACYGYHWPQASDIALIHLEQPVEFSNYIYPICLPPYNSPAPADETKCFITGYGDTKGSGDAGFLKMAEVPIIELGECAALDSTMNRYLSSPMICAGYVGGGIDSCQGDSGGPLVCPVNPSNKDVFVLQGIISFGIGCAQQNRPGVYVRVSKYVNWISNQVKKRART